jgi:hypothetical protein
MACLDEAASTTLSDNASNLARIAILPLQFSAEIFASKDRLYR